MYHEIHKVSKLEKLSQQALFIIRKNVYESNSKIFDQNLYLPFSNMIISCDIVNLRSICTSNKSIMMGLLIDNNLFCVKICP